MNRFVAALAAVTLLGTGKLYAQDNLDTTFTVRAGTRLSVNNMSGRITVTSWGRQAVRIQADDKDRVVVEMTTSRLSVRSEHRRGDDEDDVNYTITVPAGMPLELAGVSTDVDVSAVCGPVGVNVVSGDVTLACAQGDVAIQSVSGDVTVSDVRSGSVDAGSTSGDVTLRNVKGAVSANSVSGDITLVGVEGTDAAAETVSGDISFTGRIADGGRYRFEAHSGDLLIRATNAFNASVSVSTFSGEFEPDFPITIAPGTQRSREWEFTVGNGGARLSLKSFSGTITLRRGASAGRDEEE